MFKLARSIQFAWFIPGEPEKAEIVFQALAAGEAEFMQKLSPPNAPVPMTVRALVRDGKQYRLQSHFGRFDFYVEPVPSSPVDGCIADVMKEVQSLVGRAGEVADIIGTATRLAIIVNYVQPVASWNEAALFFSGLVGHENLFQESQDMVLQISRPTSYMGIELNRLMRWAGESFTNMMAAPGGQVISMQQVYMISCMADINTAPLPTATFSPNRHAEVFNQLAKRAIDLGEITTLEKFK